MNRLLSARHVGHYRACGSGCRHSGCKSEGTHEAHNTYEPPTLGLNDGGVGGNIRSRVMFVKSIGGEMVMEVGEDSLK